MSIFAGRPDTDYFYAASLACFAMAGAFFGLALAGSVWDLRGQ